jgi:TRAP-type transport system periplasmic protein
MKNKKILLILSMFLILTLAASIGCAAPAEETPVVVPDAPEESFDLKFAIPVNVGDDFTNFWQAWADDIAAASNGRINITVYMGGTLGKATEQLEMLKTGVADIVYHVPPWTPGAFPLAEAASLPYLTATPTSIYFYGNYLMQWDKVKEFDAYKPLEFGSSPSGLLFFTDKKVTTLEEMKGLKMRAAGPIGKTMETLGASSVPTPTVDVYMALERSTVDGIAIDAGALSGMKGYEVVKYGIANPLYLGTHMVIMSKATWESMPADLQLVMSEFTKGHQLRWLEFVIDWDQSAVKLMEDNGVEMYFLAPDEAERWKALLAPEIDQYIAAKGAEGLPAAEAIAAAKKFTHYEK